MTKQKELYIFFCKSINKKTAILHLHKYSDPLLSTLLKHLWQRLQTRVFLGMTLQAGHTGICGVSSYFSAYHLRLCQVGWGVSLHSYFQGNSENFPEATPALSWLCS